MVLDDAEDILGIPVNALLALCKLIGVVHAQLVGKAVEFVRTRQYLVLHELTEKFEKIHHNLLILFVLQDVLRQVLLVFSDVVNLLDDDADYDREIAFLVSLQYLELLHVELLLEAVRGFDAAELYLEVRLALHVLNQFVHLSELRACEGDQVVIYEKGEIVVEGPECKGRIVLIGCNVGDVTHVRIVILLQHLYLRVKLLLKLSVEVIAEGKKEFVVVERRHVDDLFF